MKKKRILLCLIFLGGVLLSCKDNNEISSLNSSEELSSELSSFSSEQNDETSEYVSEDSKSYVEFPYLPPTSEDEN